MFLIYSSMNLSYIFPSKRVLVNYYLLIDNNDNYETQIILETIVKNKSQMVP